MSMKGVILMFEGLDSIDWQHLTHAYGPATDVPDLIRALASPEKSMRDQALYELHGNIWHQGTVYEATAYAVPFLIRLLTYESVEDKAGILALLSCIAIGISYLAVHGDLSFYDEKRDTPEFKAELARELVWVRRARQAVGEGLPVYLELLINPDAETRMFAVHLLSCFKELAQESIPRLELLLTREKDLQVRATALISLGALSEPGAPELEHLRSYITTEKPPLLRFAAALAVARCARKATPPEAVRVHLDSVGEAETIEELYGGLPWFGSVIPDVREALVLIDPTLAIQALIDVLQTLDTGEDAWDVGEVAEALLDLAFYGKRVAKKWAYGGGKDGRVKLECWGYPGRERQDATQQEIGAALAKSSALSFTEGQRTVLTALVNYEPLWKIDTNLFEVYDLPNSREVLRKLLG